VADAYRYYAVLADGYPPERPLAVVRRTPFETGGGYDEIHGRNSGWRPTPILKEFDHGDTSYDFIEIDPDEAERLLRSFGVPTAGPHQSDG
jgi:hypothetical protein